jgi:ferritin-like metal-binding protein YciE/energy-coupling factor transporter ATP-binding protein EcfA2
VVYGPNGTGKSSIIDGIEAALEKESSLYAEKRQGVNWEKGSEHVVGGPKRAELFGVVPGQEYNLTTLKDAPANVVQWKQFAASSMFVLRRHMLLRFILTQPSDRYSSLESFFNLKEYAEIEAALGGLVSSAKSVEAGLEVAERQQAQTLRYRIGIVDSVIPDAAAANGHLEKTLNTAKFPPANTPAERIARSTAATEELAGIAVDENLTQLAHLKGKLQELLPSATFDTMLGQLSEIQQAYDSARAESLSTAPADFLATAKSLIAEQNLAECPVCEQAINPVLTVAALESRIAKDVKVSTASAALSQHRKGAAVAIQSHTSAFKSALNGLLKLFGDQLPDTYKNEAVLLDQIVGAVADGTSIENLADLRAALKATITSHEQAISKIDQCIADSGASRRTELANVLDALKIVESELPAFEATRTHLTATRNQREALERLSGHALRARRATVQGIVNGLADLANEFYEFIHPGEEISKSALEVRDVGKGSVEISTSFHGSTEHPLLHFSESHLDTLGLCYFLAARRLEADTNPAFKVLVLDDVVHSVDADHRDRIARLLKEKFADHQIVIVTHDSIFYQRLRALCGSQFQYVYFTNWTLEGGPVRIQASTDIDRVTSAEVRNAMSQDELAGACGRFGEWLFMQLDERLQVAVPARFSRPHDLGNLWPPLAAKMRKQKAFEAKKDVVDRIDASQWVRNKVGAHYNEPESPVTPAEVRQLAEALNDFFVATFCQVCGSTIAKVDDKTWKCDCGCLAYEPASAGAETAEA